MRMRNYFSLTMICVVLCHSACFAQRTAFAADSKAQTGVRGIDTWSKLAFSLPQQWDSDHVPFNIKSPDGLKLLCVRGKKTGKPYPNDDSEVEYFVVKSGRRIPGEITYDVSPEIMWSPDSAALALTSSDGGLIGSWGVQVYFVNGDRLRPADVTQEVRRDVAHAYPACVGIPCSPNDKKMFEDVTWVNVAAIAWVDGSKQLAVLAGVPPSSRYGANMGKVKGYLVEVPSGHIVQTFTKRAFVSRWKRDINTIVP